MLKPGNAIEDRYDFVVAGARSAVCVLANRLSENLEVRVLLCEAGPPDRARQIHIPAALTRLFRSDVDWAYFTEPQEQLDDRVLFWPRGKTLGGSSSIKAMVWARGCRGVPALRVVDASVMPQIIRGHTQAPTVMVAERATDLLRRENPLSTWPESREP